MLARLVRDGDPRVRHYCALCLCRLSEERGLEDWLTSEGALNASTKLVAVSESAATKVVAAKVLINLAATMEGNQADTLVKNVLKCVANLVGHVSRDGSPDPATQRFCAEAIASLACLATARPILAKQGVVAVLKMIFLTSVSVEATNACAAALCNMGQIHGCRKEMLALGLIRVISRLMRSGPPETRRLCTLCLTTLSFQKDLRAALLKEGALRTIGAVVQRREDPELTRQGAYALLSFAFDPQTREDVVAEDALPALMGLLDRGGGAGSVDDATCANSLMALCNLLADPATCPQVLEAGVLLKLVGFTADLEDLAGLHEYRAAARPSFEVCAARARGPWRGGRRGPRPSEGGRRPRAPANVVGTGTSRWRCSTCRSTWTSGRTSHGRRAASICCWSWPCWASTASTRRRASPKKENPAAPTRRGP